MTAVVLTCLLGVPGAISVQDDRDHAVQLAIKTLAVALTLEPSAVRLVSAEAVEWPNTSLGCPERGMVYMPVIVPGFNVRLAVGDREHEVHTGGGHAVVCDGRSDATASSRPSVAPGLAAADRARQQLAARLGLTTDDVRIGRVRRWRSSDRSCAPPEGTTIEGDTFLVELKRGRMTYRYRATPDIAWACK